MLWKLVVSLVIFSMFLGLCIVGEVKANFSPGPPQVTINSPLEYRPASSTVLLNVTVSVFYDTLNSSENRWITYSLDGRENVSMPPNYQGVSIISGWRFSEVTAETVLSGLAEGYHNVTVYAKYNYGSWVSEGNAKITFTVGLPQGTPAPNENAPTVTINIPSTNQAFEKNAIINYSFSVHFPPSWFKDNWVYGRLISIVYVLDNNNHVTIADEGSTNGTKHTSPTNETTIGLIHTLSAEKPDLILTGNLPVLPDGTHTIRVYALWQYPYTENQKPASSSLRSFSVGNQTIQPPNSALELINQPFILLLVIASIISATVIGIGLLVYFKKYKPQQES